MNHIMEWISKNVSWLVPFSYLVYKDMRDNSKKTKKKGASSKHKKKRR